MKTSNFDPVSSEIFGKQLRIAVLFVLVVFGILILRLWFLQIVNGSAYRAKSEHNRIRLQDIAPFRGIIFDRNNEVLVDNRPSYDLYMIPEEIQNRKRLLRSLSEFGAVEPEHAMRRLDEAPQGYPFKPVCIKKGISRDELARVETHRFDLPGVIIKVSPQRHYLYASLASHVLGYLGEISEDQLKSGLFDEIKSGDVIGKVGVERKWQSSLSGIRGGEQVEVDAAGRRIQVISRKSPVPGANIGLTIDKDFQALAEKAMGGKHGAIVAMNPNDGVILALASSPAYDPNMFIKGIDRKTWQRISLSKDYPLQNRALTGQYPPGSVFKIVVALAALQEGVVTPDEKIFCNGSFTLGRRKYRCWKKHGHGGMNLRRALVESCDVYFYNLGKRLGVDRIAHYARLFGLGKRTGLDLDHEKNGLIPTSRWKLKRWGVPWQAGETISTSIGQSFVLVTPIQATTLISAVFNGGIIYAPQVTKWARKTGSDEGVFEFTPRLVKRTGIKKEYLDLVKDALAGVVNEPKGTGSKARLEDVTVAGKTGTAQVVKLKEDDRRKDEDQIPWKHRDHAWFVAVAPAESPVIAVTVLLEHGGHGGSAAAPIAKELIEAYLKGPN